MKKLMEVPYLTRAKDQDTFDYFAVAWAKKKVSSHSVKFYHGYLTIFAGLTNCELLLILFLTELMDDGNLVENSIENKRKFNMQIKRADRKEFSESSINRAFKSLSDKMILLRLNKRKRGRYKVNPKYFFMGKETVRKKSITKDLENKIRPIANKYRAETFDVDMAKKNLKKKKDEIG